MLKESSIENELQEAIEIYNETQKTSYTKYPNKYLDKIQPLLTKCEASICNYVLRLTYGYHRPYAFITQEQFVKHCVKPGLKSKGYSHRQIINSKNSLLEMGLLKKVRKDGKWAYCIDIFYDKAVIKTPETTRPENLIPFEPDKSETDDIVNNPVDNSVENCQTEEAQVIVNIEEKSDIEESIKADEKPISKEKEMQKDSSAPELLYIDTKNSIILDQDQNKQNKNWKSVCFGYLNFFKVVDDRAFGTLGGLFAKFGYEYVISKIEIVKYNHARVKILNPIGALVDACKRDYIPAKPVRDRMEARAKAEYRVNKAKSVVNELLAAEATQRDRETRLEKIKTKLTPAKIDEYFEKAKADFAALPFVVDAAIRAKANDLILADFEDGKI